jgi:hypothetical protein
VASSSTSFIVSQLKANSIHSPPYPNRLFSLSASMDK